MSQWPTDADIALLRWFAERCIVEPYAMFPKGLPRDRLRQFHLIERYDPRLRTFGRQKPWRITETGRKVLAQK